MSAPDTYEFAGEVELFAQEGGWYYVAVPTAVSDEIAELADRGVIAVDATIGDITWPTSLLPKGDGTHFVALNAKVRAATGLDLGDSASMAIAPRQR